MEDGKPECSIARCLAARIRVEWLQIHSKKLEGADTDLCLREAYDVCAKALRDFDGELNDVVLRHGIPFLIGHWAAAVEWIPIVPPDHWYENLMECLSSRISYWQAETLKLTEKQRDRLAPQYGITPEEVSWDQIWCELPEALTLSERHARLARLEGCWVKVRAELLRIHSKKLEGADTDLCLREAYDVCAKAAIGFTGKFDREFTDVLLWQVIPAWILKHCSDEWLAAVPRRQRYEYLMKCVRGRIAHWQAEVVIPTRKEEGRSPLSDLWEAKKQLERLMDGPHEQVAEDFVRTNLALEYGIKPEEVTWKQILLEVERLSLNSDYPAVELVPTAPATDEAPGPYLFCRLLADMVDVSHVHLSAVLARWRSTIDKSSLRRALDTSPPILPPVTETRGYFALLARLSSATDESSPLEELDAAYCDHLLAFLGSHVSTPDEWWPPRELDTSPPGRAKSDELRRLTEGWLDEYRLDPRSPPPAQSEAGSSDRRKTGAEQTGSEVPATMKEADRFSADRGSGDVGSDTVMKEGIATPPGTAPYPKRAAWFEHELALREWSIHELQGQGGPDWKTSRKILDGLSVSRSVLEKTAAALSKKKKQVLFRDVPQE